MPGDAQVVYPSHSWAGGPGFCAIKRDGAGEAGGLGPRSLSSDQRCGLPLRSGERKI